MESALLGLLGVIVGVLLNEFIRRRSRIESFAEQVFKRRLDVYEQLYTLMDRAQNLGYQILDENDLNSEQRHTMWSVMVMEVANFADKNGLYLNEDLMLHCMMTLIGIDEIPDIQDNDERSAAKKEFSANFKAAREMIAAESGMSEINDVFGRIAKSEYQSDLVETARKLHNQYGN